MNCKFCGNFIPDGKDTCDVCGRRQDEQPIGQLLSDNMPNPVAAEEQREEAKKGASASAEKKKSLKLPLVLIAVSVAGWCVGIFNDFIDGIKTIWNGVFGNATLHSDTFNTDKPIEDLLPLFIVGAVAILLIVLFVVGIIMLFKRISNKVSK